MSAISRRDLFRSLIGLDRGKSAQNPSTGLESGGQENRRMGFQPVSDGGHPASGELDSGWKPELPDSQDGCPPLALILDRFCLAYQGSFCSVCSERCPADGAITVEQGKPRVNLDFCTGCKICHDVCPAPKNAVFLVARKPRQGMVARPTNEPTPS